MLFRTATTLLLSMAVACAAATTKATIDSNSNGEEGTPFRRRRNLVAKKFYRGPTQPPTTQPSPDDHGGYGSYPQVTVENKTYYAASGQVVYSVGNWAAPHKPDMFHLNPGETWTAPDERNVKLIRCVMATLDGLPVPLNMARDYESTGTSFSQFEIIYKANADGFVVERPGGNYVGWHIADCANLAKRACTDYYIYPTCGDEDPYTHPESCGDYPWRIYHPVWPPVDGMCPAAPPSEKPTEQPNAVPLTVKPTMQPTTGRPTKLNPTRPDDPWCANVWEGLYDPCDTEYNQCMTDAECFNVRHDIAAKCDCEDEDCDCDAHLHCANNVVNASGIKDTNTALNNIMACVERQKPFG